MSLIWTNAALEPKRKFRYLITFGDPTGLLGDFTFLAQTCDRPGVKVANTEHKYFDKTYNHPGRVTWDPNPLNIKLVDIQRNSISATDTNESLLVVFKDSGLNGLIGSGGEVRTVGKQAAVQSLGLARIRVLNAAVDASQGGPASLVTNIDNGMAEEWTLRNAWLESFKPDALDYGSDDILTVTIQVRYDWAEFRANGKGPTINPFDPAGNI
jgi:hypothetical protein